MRKNNRSILIAGVLILLIQACSPANIKSTWRDVNYSGKPTHILVLGVTQKEAVRQIFEGEFVKQLQANNLMATPSFTILPSAKQLDKQSIINKAHETGADFVLLTRLLSQDQAKETTSTIRYDAANYNTRNSYANRGQGWYKNYSSSYSTVRSTEQTITITSTETGLYELDSERRVWSAISETITIETGLEDIKLLIKELITQLKKDALI